ncbi:uncharacterized protein Dana_GF27299 [Drosophila ananassae]|uniref:MARVEL domain-containing protein n=1 Tax=Drosophila ananassae TaxID=7217 RepID=A0A0P9AEY8_DROAN|nr:uncharacterized protein LOC26513949 isoform X1 [Drosophila ananassae]KPU76464.1 uncharacterized protein Dana_GF27299 [Drosophila ananassae]
MCELNDRFYCLLVAVMAYVVGIPQCIYKGYILAAKSHWNIWYIIFLVAWIMIFLAAILLIVGSLTDKRPMLLTWLIVVLIFAVLVMIVKIWELVFVWKEWGIILGIVSIVFYIALIFCFLYYPYVYQRNLKSEQNYY